MKEISLYSYTIIIWKKYTILYNNNMKEIYYTIQ